MLHILLLILKIIGIVLLVILGTLLLGIFCALFVPVRYRIEAVRREGEGEPPVAVRVKVTWLLHLINLLIRFNGEIFVRARIFLFTVFRMPQKERRRKKSEKEEKGRKKRRREKEEKPKRLESGEESGQQPGMPVETAQDGGVSQERRADDSRTEQKEEGVISQEHFDRADETTQTRSIDEDRDESAEAQEKPGFWDKLCVLPKILRTFFEKIRGLFENIQYTFNSFCDKISSISETIEYYREIVEGEPFKHSFDLCRGELLAVFKSLKPRKFEASLVVGMDDPAATGEVLAVCGMLYPLIGSHVDVRGDFENRRLEGQVLVVGKIRAFTFLRTAVKIYFNKDIRKLYRLLKKEAVNG